MRVDEAGRRRGSRVSSAEVEESSARRAPVVAMADRMAGIFVAVVLVLAAVTFALWVGRNEGAA